MRFYTLNVESAKVVYKNETQSANPKHCKPRQSKNLYQKPEP